MKLALFYFIPGPTVKEGNIVFFDSSKESFSMYI